MGYPKVANYECFFLMIEEDVLWLNISMNNSIVMKMFNSVAQRP